MLNSSNIYTNCSININIYTSLSNYLIVYKRGNLCLIFKLLAQIISDKNKNTPIIFVHKSNSYYMQLY